MVEAKNVQLRLDRLGDQPTRAGSQNFGEWIVDCPFLSKGNNSILGHGVTLLLGGSGGLITNPVTPPSSHRHPISRVAQSKSAIGPWNFSEVSPVQMMGRFNGFLKSVILRVSEARDLGDTDRYGFYEHTKPIIAAPLDVERVDEKNLREHAVFNVVGVVITTNNKSNGIYLPADDRRHYVAWSDLSRTDFAEDYFTSLYEWFTGGGDRQVAEYLSKLDLAGFNPKAPPPHTPAFWEIVGSAARLRTPKWPTRSTAWATLTVYARHLAANASEEFSEWLRDRKNSRQIPYRLEQCGYVAVRNDAAEDGRWVLVWQTAYGILQG